MRRGITFMICAGLVFACGGGSPAPKVSGDPNRAVALGEWCKTLTQTMCVRAASCIGSIEMVSSCNETAMPSCLAGRSESTPSGHNGAELATCDDTFQSSACDGYMGAVASHTECQAR